MWWDGGTLSVSAVGRSADRRTCARSRPRERTHTLSKPWVSTRLTAVQRQLFSCSHATVDAILWRSASIHQNDDVGNELAFAFNAADVIMAGSKHTCHMQLAKHEAFQFFFSYFSKKRRGVTDALIQGFNAFLMAEATFS